jgi:hypothetical protein
MDLNTTLHQLLKNGTSSNYQLITIAQKVGIPLKKVLYKDQLRQFPAQAGAYIINLQDSTIGTEGQVSHWTALYLTKYGKKRQSFYFDSFGQICPQEVLKFAKRFGAPDLYYSRDQIQSLNTNYCGQYSVNFLYFMATKKGNPYERYMQFLKQFSPVRRF